MRVRTSVAAAVLAGLVVIVTWPQVLRMGRGVPDFGDPLLNAWAIAWIAHALSSSPARVLDGNAFHPERTTLAFSETLLLPGLVTAPLLWAGADPILAHNLLLLAGYWISGIVVLVLVRRLTGHDGGALVAGAIFAVLPYRIEQYSHVQIELAFGLPLALLTLHRVLERPGARRAAALGLVLGLGFYTSVYLAVFTLIVLAPIASVLLVTDRRESRSRAVVSLGVAALVAAGVVVPVAMAYRSATALVGHRTLADAERGSAIVSDYQRSHPENAFYGDDGHPGEAERRLFPGWTPVVLAAAAMVPPAGPAVVAYAAGGIIAAELSFGVHSTGYRWLYAVFWPLRAIRVPARLAMAVGLALAVLSGFGIARLCRGRSLRVQTSVVAMALAFVTMESRMRPQQLVELPDPDPAVYQWLAQQPRGVVCEYPLGNLEGRLGPQDATYMYYSTRHWQPIVNGYSGFEPPSYQELRDRLRTFPDDRALSYLRARGVAYLLVHGGFYLGPGFEEDVAALRQRGDVAWIGAFAWRDGQTTHAFRLLPAAPPSAPGGRE